MYEILKYFPKNRIGVVLQYKLNSSAFKQESDITVKTEAVACSSAKKNRKELYSLKRLHRIVPLQWKYYNVLRQYVQDFPHFRELVYFQMKRKQIEMQAPLWILP